MVVQRAVVSSAPLAGLMMIASPVGFMCDDVDVAKLLLARP